MGKTNVLDAIYYICMAKSFFSHRESHVASHGSDFFRIEVDCSASGGPTKLVAKVQPGKSKHIEINAEKLPRSSEIVGRYPVVMISTKDDRLILEGGTARRRYYNNLLAQMDRAYFDALAAYHQLLKRRNALLKDDRTSPSAKRSLMMQYSEGMNAHAKLIQELRTSASMALAKAVRSHYAKLSQSQEDLHLSYLPNLEGKPLMQLHEETIGLDLATRRTSRGIHRDDLLLELNGQRLKDFGSQGQIKSAVISLRLAQYDLLKASKSSKPLILLDDIFDRLDQTRVSSLVRLLIDDEVGQIFMTDTDADRVAAVMEAVETPHSIFTVDHGEIQKVI